MSALSTVAATTVIACTSMPLVQGNALLKGKLSVAAQVQAEAKSVSLKRESLAASSAVPQRSLRGANGGAAPRALWGLSKVSAAVTSWWEPKKSLSDFEDLLEGVTPAAAAIEELEKRGASVDMEKFVGRVSKVLREKMGAKNLAALVLAMRKMGRDLDHSVDGCLEKGHQTLEGVGVCLAKEKAPVSTFLVRLSYAFMTDKNVRAFVYALPQIGYDAVQIVVCISHDVLAADEASATSWLFRKTFKCDDVEY